MTVVWHAGALLDALRDACLTHCVTHAGAMLGAWPANGSRLFIQLLSEVPGEAPPVVISGFAGAGQPHACWVPLSRKWEMKGSVGPWNGPAGDQSQWD